MTNPYDPPDSTVDKNSKLSGLESEMTETEYWRMVANRRNYFLIILLLLIVSNLAININAEVVITSELMVLTVSGFKFFGVFLLFWLGYRVTTTKCYKCGNKLVHGHFIRIKKILCKQCGYTKPNGT